MGYVVKYQLWPLLIFWLRLSLFATFSTSHSQEINFQEFQRFSVTNGLPSNEITALAEDSYGFLWVGTSKGLVRFDGSEFVPIAIPLDNNTTVADNAVHSLQYEPSSQTIWVGTARGLFYTSINQSRLKKHRIYQGVLNPVIKDILHDSRGCIWVVGNQGLGRIDTNDNFNFEIYFDGNHPLFNKATAILLEPASPRTIWVGSIIGLIKYDIEAGSIQHFKDGPDPKTERNRVRNMAWYNDFLYYGTWSSGCIRFDPKKRTFSQMYFNIFDKATNQGVTSLAEFNSNLLISHEQGVIILPKDSLAIQLKINEFDRGLLKGFSLQDQNNNIWYGTHYGLYKYSITDPLVQNIVLTKRSEFDIQLNLERIILHRNHLIAVGFGSEGIYVVNLKDLKTKVLPLPIEFKESKYFHLTDIERLTDNIFLLVNDPYLLEFDFEDQKIKQFETQLPYASPSIEDTEVDKYGNIWVGSRKEGLQKITPSGTIKNYKNFSEEDTIAYPWVNKLFIDSQENLWLCRGSETYLAMPMDSIFESGKRIEEHLRGVSSVLEDRGGRVWMAGTHDGMGYKLSRDPEKPIKMVMDGYVEEIYPFNDSLIWLMDGTLKIFNLKSRTFQKTYFEKITKQYRINGPIEKISDSIFAIAHQSGILLVNLDGLNFNPKPEKVYLVSFSVDGESLEIPLSFDSLSTQLPQHTKSIGLDFNTLNHELYNEQYYYTLNEDKISLNRALTINVTNLSPGDYSLKIFKKSFRPSPDELRYNLSFYIPTPWYNTSLFYMLLIILMVSAFYVLYKIQLSRKIASQDNLRLKQLDDLKTKFYSNITHEFRTPLTVILGIENSISQRLSLEQKAIFADLKLIKRNGRELLQLVDKMIGISKIDSGYFNLRIQNSDIISFIKYILESFEYAANLKGITISFTSNHDYLCINFDKDVINTIISNLLSNAIKNTAKGGSIQVSFLTQTKSWELCVQDSGSGIAPKDLAKIFDRYFQVPDNSDTHTGSGIGLSLTKDLVEKLDGQISVTSQIGKGTEFRITVPILPQPIEQVSQNTSNSINENLDGSIPKILIIEDNPDLRYYLKSLISKSSYIVLEASDGIVGMELALQILPDLIITDIMMPNMDGIKLCSELKDNELTDHIPIIMLTAKNTIQDKIDGISHGADAYISKPFKEEELLVTIGKLIELRIRLREKYGQKSESDNGNPDFVAHPILAKINSIILEHLAESNFGIQELAYKTAISESQLYRKVKALTGMSTAIYIRTCRLHQAKSMLTESNLNISEIAYSTGFNDPSWFTKAFKTQFGISPKEFLRSLKK
ncbi:Signal transduction histidine kinase [Flavobacteriaceae bacterium MAR_2010_188]|nr:Signal transduction histidine kinase [Flavobacteriaceae bacterium MAR_2010_188]